VRWLAIATILSLFGPAQSTVTIRVIDEDSGQPIFARVVLKNGAGEVIESTGYKTLNGHVATPEGWQVSLSTGKYSLHVDAGFEFFATDEDWHFDGSPRKEDRAQEVGEPFAR
jgi:hypothetical protein